MKHSVVRSSRRALGQIIQVSILSIVGNAGAVRAGTDQYQARVVTYAKSDIVPVRAKLRFSTLIVLPENEEILDFTTGDAEFWIINGAHNICYVHPAQAGIRSNLNLVTASGHVYSFLLTEISKDPKAEPDLKLFVEPTQESGALQGYVRAAEAEAYKKELEAVRAQADDEVRAARSQVDEQVDKIRSNYQASLQFDYELDPKASREPFLIRAIYHDDAFTYIKSAAREKPTLYEVKDGKPNLINFELQNGVYIVSKVLDSGYFTIGEKKFTFLRRARSKDRRP